MQLRITLKKMLAKPSILTIVRNDGTSTWSKLFRGLETHDIVNKWLVLKDGEILSFDFDI